MGACKAILTCWMRLSPVGTARLGKADGRDGKRYGGRQEKRRCGGMQRRENKRKALEMALQQIEKELWQGRGDASGSERQYERESIPTGPWLWMRLWASAACPAAALWRFTGPEASGKPLWPFTLWLRRRNWAARPRSRRGACAGSCICRALGVDVDSLLVPSRIPASRRWKLRRH